MKKISFIFLFIFCFASLIFSQFVQETNEPKRLYKTSEETLYENLNRSYEYTIQQNTFNSQYNYYAEPLASDDNEKGSSTATYEGYSATVYWEINAPVLGVVLWTITYTYEDGTTETVTFWGSKGNAKNEAIRISQEKALEKAKEKAHSVPISNIPFIALFIFVFVYIIYRKYCL